jgi:ribosomal protein S18 acetylase RimI-like enzyme
MEITIQKAKPTDKDVLLTLSKQTFIDTYYHLNKPENIDDYIASHFNLHQIEIDLADHNNLFYIAWLDEKAVGYFKLRWKTPEELAEHKVIEIERIYVDKRFQGKKTGKALMQKAIDTAKELDCNYVWLGVWNQNANALAFYKKQGFEIFGTHVFMMGSEAQEDYLMKKKI